MTRRTRLALALPLAGLLLAGCAQTRIGAAAQVGGTRIETTTVGERVERGYANQQFQQRQSRAEYQRSWLTNLITREVTRVAARRLGVSVTDQQVEERIQQFARDVGGMEALEQRAATQGIAKEDVRDAIGDLVLSDAVADKLVEDVEVTEEQLRAAYREALPQFDVARIAHIAVSDKKTADQVAKDARAGKDFAVLAKEFSRDANTAAEGGELGQIGNGEGKFEPAFEKAVFGAASGDILGPIKAGSGYEIVKVIERRTRTYEQARDEVRRGVIGQRRIETLNTYLADVAKDLGVSVNPRFGRWDMTTMRVAELGNDLSAPVPSPGEETGVVPGPGGQPGAPPAQGGQPGAPPQGGQPGAPQPGQPGGQPGGQQPPATAPAP